MSKLPVISGTKAIKAFSKAGWFPHRQVGSHVVLRKISIKLSERSEALIKLKS